jgi:hypothetical protein
VVVSDITRLQVLTSKGVPLQVLACNQPRGMCADEVDEERGSWVASANSVVALKFTADTSFVFFSE